MTRRSSRRCISDTDVGENAGYPFTGGVTGIPIANPLYSGFTPPNTHDVGVVLLDEGVVMAEYGQLPDLGTLDALKSRRGKKNTTFDVAGYGLQYIRLNPEFGPVFLEADLVRRQAMVSLVNLSNALVDGFNIMYSGDSGRGNQNGGTCFGDSGGPVFLSGTNIVVGITSFGLNNNCTGPGFAYRTDIEETQEFLSWFLDD